MIPDINRPEWEKLITGEITPDISSFSLQMKIEALKTSYKNRLMSIENAIKDLHSLCSKYERIYKNDFDNIFK